MPPSMAEWLPADHEVWFVIDLVEQLDLGAIESTFRLGGAGRQAYRPSMLLTLLIYGYSQGVVSSRRLERACVENVAFRVIAGNDTPDHATIARFRQHHLAAVEDLFVQVLARCAQAGLIQLGAVALDGTKMQANAAMGANRDVDRLRDKVADLLRQAEEADAAEDETFGDRRGDELPADLVDPAARARRIAEILAGVDEDPDPPTKVNMTDPESRLMPSTKGFLQGYNAQVITGADQIVLATGVTQVENDYQALPAMVAALLANLQAVGIADVPGVLLADAGYLSADNLDALDHANVPALIATGKTRDLADTPANDDFAEREAAWAAVDAELAAAETAERRRRAVIFERIEASGQLIDEVLDELGISRANAFTSRRDWRTGGADAIRLQRRRRPRRPVLTRGRRARNRMQTALADPTNRAIYKRRGDMVETYFGNLKANKGIDRFTRRGLNAVRQEWVLHGIVNNIDKLRTTLTGPATQTA